LLKHRFFGAPPKRLRQGAAPALVKAGRNCRARQNLPGETGKLFRFDIGAL
jgi:hypothetical protein